MVSLNLSNLEHCAFEVSFGNVHGHVNNLDWKSCQGSHLSTNICKVYESKQISLRTLNVDELLVISTAA